MDTLLLFLSCIVICYGSRPYFVRYPRMPYPRYGNPYRQPYPYMYRYRPSGPSVGVGVGVGIGGGSGPINGGSGIGVGVGVGRGGGLRPGVGIGVGVGGSALGGSTGVGVGVGVSGGGGTGYMYPQTAAIGGGGVGTGYMYPQTAAIGGGGGGTGYMYPQTAAIGGGGGYGYVYPVNTGSTISVIGYGSPGYGGYGYRPNYGYGGGFSGGFYGRQYPAYYNEDMFDRPKPESSLNKMRSSRRIVSHIPLAAAPAPAVNRPASIDISNAIAASPVPFTEIPETSVSSGSDLISIAAANSRLFPVMRNGVWKSTA